MSFKKYNLGESATLKARIGWQGLTTAEYQPVGDYYLITGTDFKNGFIDWDNCVYVERNRYDQDKNIQVEVGDVLVTKDGTIGKVAYIDELQKPTTLNSGVFVIRPKKKAFHAKYFYYVLMSNHFSEFLSRLTAGSTISHLYQKDFVFFNFLAPSLPEQRAIAQVLSDTDSLIAGIEQKLAKKRAIKQGAMQELLRPKEGWEVKKLVDVVNYIHGKAHENYIVEDGKYIAVNSKFISTEGRVSKRSNHNFCKAKEGDVLTVLSDLPNGKALSKCFYVDEDEKYAVNQRICIWRTKGSNPMFLFFLLNRNKYFMKLDDGVTQTHILNHHIEKCKISLPISLEEQTRIANILSDMDSEIEQLEEKLSKSKVLKQGLMQQLLTGKIRLV